MENFWDYNVWGAINVIAALLLSLLAANALKKSIRWLQASLIPTSVLGGLILIAIASVYKLITGDIMFDSKLFGGNGTAFLEIITYHTLALGFIASSLKSSKNKMSKQRSVEIFNSGVTTVATYLIQAVFGMGITMIAALFLKELLSAAGVLLPFGYGQGPGQALNYGNIYESQFGFVGGKSFGLTIAAMGFISASIGGVIHLNILKKKGKLVIRNTENNGPQEEVEEANEVPMMDNLDKLTIQVAFVIGAYFLAFLLMNLLGNLMPGMRSVIFGFNFLLGVIAATLIKVVLNLLRKSGMMKKQYTNNFLLTRTSNFFFDVMIVASIAAIRFGDIEAYWGVLIILGVVGLLITYAYCRFVAKKLFPEYMEEQFLATFGMLTGTASTGVALLREIDQKYVTPAADNLVYQNFPAIVFGFPMMLLATLAPVKPVLTFIILVAFFLAMNVILFRSFIFKGLKKKTAKKD